MRIEPEYPSWRKEDLAQTVSARLRKSRLRHRGRYGKAVVSDADWPPALGTVGDYEHSNSSAANEWLSGWKIVGSSSTSADVQSSLSVYAGFSDSHHLGSTDGLHKGGPPYVDISVRMVRYCQRLAELYLAFWGAAQKPLSHDDLLKFRQALFVHLDPAGSTPQELRDILDAYSDTIFVTRMTRAAVRWAIAHEMAHAVATRRVRKEYERLIRPLCPDLDEQWRSAGNAARTNYRDEIACDLLAVDFVLNSPFARDDIMTEAGGSLLALMATVWDGWFTDHSARSATHPSPTLRFRIVNQYWLQKFADEATWGEARPPGPLGVVDHAIWTVFERWSAGEYGPLRSGDVWRNDLAESLIELAAVIPSISLDDVYVMNPDGSFARVQRR